MSDIGLFGPGFDTFVAALGIMALGTLLALVASLTAIIRSLRRGTPILGNSATPVAVGSLAGVALAFPLAVYADAVGFETGAVLDAWLVAIVAGIVLLASFAGWGAKRVIGA